MALFGGTTVTYRAPRPKPETATATFASPPPNVATNWGDCRKRSNPGGLRRSMISPKETTVFAMNPRFYQSLRDFQQIGLVLIGFNAQTPIAGMIDQILPQRIARYGENVSHPGATKQIHSGLAKVQVRVWLAAPTPICPPPPPPPAIHSLP